MRSSWEDFIVPNKDAFEPYQVLNYANDDEPFHRLWLSLPKGKKNVPLMIFFHGGGMTADGREAPDYIYDGDFAVVEPKYRLSPAAKAPAQIDDAALAIAWCFEHAEEFGFDTSKIFVGGMSAGAYLAAITVMNPKFLAPYGLHYRNIAGLIILSGQMTKHFKIKEEMGDTRGQFVPNFDEYAPMANLAADLPPMLLVTGQSGLDMPARPEENSFVAASLKSMGHPFVRCFNLMGHHHGMVLEGSNELIRQFLPAVLQNKPEDMFE